MRYLIARPRWKLCACRNVLQEAASQDAKANFYRGERRNQKKEGTYIDKDGVARTFDRKKISRKRGNDSATKHSFYFQSILQIKKFETIFYRIYSCYLSRIDCFIASSRRV